MLVAWPVRLRPARKPGRSHRNSEGERGRRRVGRGPKSADGYETRRSPPAILVDPRAVGDLVGIHRDGEGLHIGAMTTHARIGDEGSIRETCPALTDAIERITDPQVRNRATIGGSLCRNDPAADLPAVALALDAMIQIVGSTGPRTVPAGEFLVGPFETLAKRGDVVTEVLFPGTAGAVGSAYEKFKNPATGLALCGIAALLRRASGGAIEKKCRVAATGVADCAVRLRGVEEALEGAMHGGYLGRGGRAKRRGSAFRLRSFRIERISRTPVHVLTKRELMRALNRSGAN